MDEITTIGGLQNEVLAHCRERGWVPNDKNLAISVAIEAAELLEHFQWDDYGDRTDNDEVAMELADVLIYALQFAAVRDIDVATAIRLKLKRAAEKYPVGQSAEEHYAAKLAARRR